MIRDYLDFKWHLHEYPEVDHITNFRLQDNLTEEWVNEVIASERILISKIKVRLTERLRERMDSRPGI